MTTARRHRLVEVACQLIVAIAFVLLLAAASAIYGGPA